MGVVVGCEGTATSLADASPMPADGSVPDARGLTGQDASLDASLADREPVEDATLPDPNTLFFSEDFEATPDDAVPDGWDSFVGYVVNMNNDPGGPAFALVDSSRPRGGNRALHVRGGQQPAMLTRPLPSGVDRVYVRVYVWLTGRLGQNPGNNHETLLGIRASVGGAHDEVRFGEIKGVIGTNEVPSDDISPKMDEWGMGPIIDAGRWNCLEVAFLANGPNHEVRAWNDGVEVHRVNDPSQWNNRGLGADFLADKFNEFIVGWHSFSNYDNEIWFDDLVVANERVGCN